MPRFHFNVYDGVSALDPTGTELTDWPTARLEAVRLAGALMADDAQQIAVGEDWRLEVTDEAGLVLFRLDVTAQEPIATMTMTSPERGAV